MKIHLRKLAILAVSMVFKRRIVLTIIGQINKRYRWIESVFVVYPFSEKQASFYAYKSYRSKMNWYPWPVGILKQGGKLGIISIISTTEQDFTNDTNIKNLEALVANTTQIQSLLGASQVNFAGILPSVLHSKNIISNSKEAEVTTIAVTKAESLVREMEGYDETPIILLGGAGFIGRRLQQSFAHREVYSVDIKEGTSWPTQLKGKKAVVINVTKKSALKSYLPSFWSELILLNEVYPEPCDEELTILKSLGCPTYHISGIKGQSYPGFPGAYSGAIPCCAGIIASPEMDIVVKKLV